MRSLHAEIEIEAPAERVWQVLSDLESYSQWNPFLQRVSGVLEPDEYLRVFIKPPGAWGMTIKPRVIAVEESAGFSWIGHILFRGIFDGEHYFIIDPLDESRCRFVQGELFTGLLAIPILWLIRQGTRRGFQAMNQALKVRVESDCDSEGTK